MEGLIVSVERVIATPAAELFAIISNPNEHPKIDGSGSVIKTKSGTPETLQLGSKFGMSMKVGVPYSMVNTVIEFEQDRRIAWQTVLSGPLGRLVGGRIWRYELDESGGSTKVTESWDITHDKQKFMLKNKRMADDATKSMTKTLDRLAEITNG